MSASIKLLFTLYFAIFICIFIPAEEKFYKIDEQKNDYVLYADSRNGNTILGIMLDENDSYIVRKYNIDTKEELIYRISYEISETKISTKEYSIIKGKENDDYSDLIDISLIIQARDEIDFTVFPEDVNISQKYDNNKKREYVFKYWVPVLNLYSIDFGKDRKLQLIDMGRTEKKQKSRFYTISKWPSIIEGPTYTIPAAKKMNIQYDEISIDIDRNWKQDGNSLVLSNSTPRDAQINFNNYNFDSDEENIYKSIHMIGIIKLLIMEVPIIAESLKIDKINNCIIFDYYIYNQDDNMSTHVFDVYKVLESNRIDNMTLYSYSTLYKDNYEYFIKIIQKAIGQES